MDQRNEISRRGDCLDEAPQSTPTAVGITAPQDDHFPRWPGLSRAIESIPWVAKHFALLSETALAVAPSG